MGKLLRFMKPYALPFAGVLVLVFLQSLADLNLPGIMSHIVDKGIVGGDTAFIWRQGGLMLLVATGGILATIGSALLSSRTALSVGRDLRSAVFSSVESFSLHEFDTIGTATLITRTTNDIVQLQNFVVMAQRMMLGAPMMMIGGIIMATREDPALSLIFVVVIPVLILAIVGIASFAMPLFKRLQLKVDKLNLVLREQLMGIRVIRAFDRVISERKRFETANEDLTKTALGGQRIFSLLMPVMMLLINATTIAIVWFGAHRVEAGAIQVGQMMAFLQYAMLILFSLIMASMMFIMWPRASVSATRVNEVLETKPGIVDPPVAKGGGCADGFGGESAGVGKAAERGHIEFRDVSFRYAGAEADAISGISFEAKPGEVTAIIGGTGSGKSTLVNLIPRFYDVQGGQVLVDCVDIRDMSQEDLRAKIGFVPQKAVLFTGSVADNIRYGRKDASMEDVVDAATVAQAAEFIGEMPEGYDSLISQGGTNVSGGQKQRLSMARALVRKPEIYVFDDAFSALDFKTDAKLRAALRPRIAEATVIIVAQRISSIIDADRIIVLDEGRMAGMGSHRELLATNPVYREIASSQLSEEELS